jgi:ferredoxin like protein
VAIRPPARRGPRRRRRLTRIVDWPVEPLDERLQRVVFHQGGEPHIVLDAAVCARCAIDRVCVPVCPAGNYREGERRGVVTVATESCMECGACRIACTEGAVRWRWPRGGAGVCYTRG